MDEVTELLRRKPHVVAVVKFQSNLPKPAFDAAIDTVRLARRLTRTVHAARRGAWWFFCCEPSAVADGRVVAQFLTENAPHGVSVEVLP